MKKKNAKPHYQRGILLSLFTIPALLMPNTCIVDLPRAEAAEISGRLLYVAEDGNDASGNGSFSGKSGTDFPSEIKPRGTQAERDNPDDQGFCQCEGKTVFLNGKPDGQRVNRGRDTLKDQSPAMQ